jgi:hypothetical protein
MIIYYTLLGSTYTRLSHLLSQLVSNAIELSSDSIHSGTAGWIQGKTLTWVGEREGRERERERGQGGRGREKQREGGRETEGEKAGSREGEGERERERGREREEARDGGINGA